MSQFHHKRRHSWPYCGSASRSHNRSVPIITVTGPPDELKEEFLAPVKTEGLVEGDDAASAGIVRSEDRPHRAWYHSQRGERNQQASAGGISMRKKIQPPLNRARSLFIFPAAMSAGETTLLPYWIHRLSAHPIHPNATKERGSSRDDVRGRLTVKRNHRRCHSERPRAWKEPSEDLWTLQEESP